MEGTIDTLLVFVVMVGLYMLGTSELVAAIRATAMQGVALAVLPALVRGHLEVHAALIGAATIAIMIHVTSRAFDHIDTHAMTTLRDCYVARAVSAAAARRRARRVPGALEGRARGDPAARGGGAPRAHGAPLAARRPGARPALPGL